MTAVVSPRDEQIKGWNHTAWGQKIAVDQRLSDADPKDYDALLLPGGVMNPDALRTQPAAVAFVKAFFDAGERAAAICHGPGTLIESGVAANYRMTSWPSTQDGHPERRGRVGRSGSGRGPHSRHQPQTR
jgi:protease I